MGWSIYFIIMLFYLFIFLVYVYTRNLFLNVSLHLCLRITNLELITNWWKINDLINNPILINFLIKRVNILI